MRRRALLAASGGNNSLFPINLIEGDNGEVGVSLYNFILSLAPENQELWGVNYYFKDGEVTIEGERCLRTYAFSMEVDYHKRVQLFTPTYNSESMYCYFLHSDGIVELYED
jgi:hypothetical protein